MRGRENPNLLPKGAITVRMHSVGGWGAITTGKNLADDAVRTARLRHQGQPEIRLGEEGPADHLLPVGGAGADPHQLRIRLCRRGALARPQRVRPLQPAFGPEEGRRLHHPVATWARKPGPTSRSGRRSSSSTTRSASSISTPSRSPARRRAVAELQLRMQGNAFQGAFFAASPMMANAGLTEERLFQAIEDQLQSKFGGKGKRVVENNLQVVKRGFLEMTEITDKQVGATRRAMAQEGRRPADHAPADARGRRQGRRHPSLLGTDRPLLRHRQGHDNLVDPFIGMSADAGRHRRLPRHDRHPLRASGLDRRELHRLRQLLHRLPGQRHSRSGVTRSAMSSTPRSTASKPAASPPASCAARRAPSRRSCAA